jgi:prolyl-tRNA synthetase
VGVHLDLDDTKQPGWKFHEYELLGIPVRIEIGPRDLDKGQVVIARRDTGKKEFVSLTEASDFVIRLLAQIQKDMLDKARAFREANTFPVESYSEFKRLIEEKGGFFIAAWCQSRDCETRVKDETKATIRCLPLDENFHPFNESAKCMVCGSSQNNLRAIFARSY